MMWATLLVAWALWAINRPPKGFRGRPRVKVKRHAPKVDTKETLDLLKKACRGGLHQGQ